MDKRMMNSTKLLWHMDRVEAWERGERISPIAIDMGATKGCNIKCVYCYGNYQHMTGEQIKPEVLVQLFKDAPKIGIKSIALIGDGEPTLNKGIWEAMDVGKAGGLDIAISTNGVLLDESKIDNILRNCVWMRFNLAAGSFRGYKKIHGTDDFYKVLQNIETTVRLKRERGYSCDVGIQSVFVPGLMDEEVVKEARLAKKLGVDYFLIKQCSLPEGNKSVNKISFNPKSYSSPKVMKALRTCEEMSDERTQIIVKWALMDLQREFTKTGKRPYEGCLGIPFLIQISGNGKVYPCGHLFGKENDKYLMGDLHEQGIEQIVRSDKYWNVVEMMKNFDVHNGCHGACRQDKVNEFVYQYTQKPRGINFI